MAVLYGDERESEFRVEGLSNNKAWSAVLVVSGWMMRMMMMMMMDT